MSTYNFSGFGGGFYPGSGKTGTTPASKLCPEIVNGRADNVFCAVRPPGHHMGPAGAVDTQDLADEPEGSQGFCLLNNVAIGAAYAKCVHRKNFKKVAIIDFDVHHGNGTEAIVFLYCLPTP